MKTWVKIALILAFFLIISPLLYVYIVYWNKIVFLPHTFVQEYWKFLGSLCSVLFGFILVNVLLRAQQKNEVIGQAKRLLSDYLIKLNWLCGEVTHQISVVYAESELEKHKKREEKISELVKRIGKLSKGLENISLEPRALEDDIIRIVYLDGILGELLILAEKATEIKNFRTHYEDFNQLTKEMERLSRLYLDKLSNNN